MDGPRFNSRAEITALRAGGVSAVSQTAGQEVVLAEEAELPIALFRCSDLQGASDYRPD